MSTLPQNQYNMAAITASHIYPLLNGYQGYFNHTSPDYEILGRYLRIIIDGVDVTAEGLSHINTFRQNPIINSSRNYFGSVKGYLETKGIFVLSNKFFEESMQPNFGYIVFQNDRQQPVNVEFIIDRFPDPTDPETPTINPIYNISNVSGQTSNRYDLVPNDSVNCVMDPMSRYHSISFTLGPKPANFNGWFTDQFKSSIGSSAGYVYLDFYNLVDKLYYLPDEQGNYPGSLIVKVEFVNTLYQNSNGGGSGEHRVFIGEIDFSGELLTPDQFYNIDSNNFNGSILRNIFSGSSSLVSQFPALETGVDENEVPFLTGMGFTTRAQLFELPVRITLTRKSGASWAGVQSTTTRNSQQVYDQNGNPVLDENSELKFVFPPPNPTVNVNGSSLSFVLYRTQNDYMSYF